MINLEEVQTRLGALSCPICKGSAFAIHPRGEASFAEQSYKARCNQCAYMFPISIPTQSLQLVDPDTAQWVMGLSCPACQETGTRLDFRCMLSVRESVAFITCIACHHPFSEKAPMEAYE
jgi:Zn finger protein HypA/HybF involved in hydrogenase expression